MEADSGGSFNMEADFGGRFQYGGRFFLHGGGQVCFARKSKTCSSLSSFFNKGKST
jgi:hypothetical protein